MLIFSISSFYNFIDLYSLCVHMCMRLSKRRTARALLCHSPSYSLETGSHTEPGAMLVASKLQQCPCFHPPPSWSYRCL